MAEENRPFSSPQTARTLARAALAPRETGHLKNTGIWDDFVRIMRLGLPFAALALGAVTVSWPLLNDQEVSFTLSKEEAAPSDGKVRMTGLNYVGSDARNRLFRVSATSGLQDDPGTPRIQLDGIRAEMELAPLGLATVTAKSGIYRMRENTLSLIGSVEMVAENGYRLTVAGAELDLKAQTAVGQGAVSGRAPLGTLEAGGMELRIEEELGLFSNGVKMHIIPKRRAADRAEDPTTQGTPR